MRCHMFVSSEIKWKLAKKWLARLLTKERIIGRKCRREHEKCENVIIFILCPIDPDSLWMSLWMNFAYWSPSSTVFVHWGKERRRYGLRRLNLAWNNILDERFIHFANAINFRGNEDKLPQASETIELECLKCPTESLDAIENFYVDILEPMWLSFLK